MSEASRREALSRIELALQKAKTQIEHYQAPVAKALGMIAIFGNQACMSVRIEAAKGITMEPTMVSTDMAASFQPSLDNEGRAGGAVGFGFEATLEKPNDNQWWNYHYETQDADRNKVLKRAEGIFDVEWHKSQKDRKRQGLPELEDPNWYVPFKGDGPRPTETVGYVHRHPGEGSAHVLYRGLRGIAPHLRPETGIKMEWKERTRIGVPYDTRDPKRKAVSRGPLRILSRDLSLDEGDAVLRKEAEAEARAEGRMYDGTAFEQSLRISPFTSPHFDRSVPPRTFEQEVISKVFEVADGDFALPDGLLTFSKEGQKDHPDQPESAAFLLRRDLTGLAEVEMEAKNLQQEINELQDPAFLRGRIAELKERLKNLPENAPLPTRVQIQEDIESFERDVRQAERKDPKAEGSGQIRIRQLERQWHEKREQIEAAILAAQLNAIAAAASNVHPRFGTRNMRFHVLLDDPKYPKHLALVGIVEKPDVVIVSQTEQKPDGEKVASQK